MIREVDASGFNFYQGESKVKYVSVTQAMSHIVPVELQEWMKRTPGEECEKKRVEATSAGTLLHLEVEHHFQRGGPETAPVKALKELLAKQDLKIVDTEVLVKSDEYGFAGRIDFILEDEQGMKYVADLKTGRTYSVTTGWQLAAYRLAYLEQNPDLLAVGMIGVHMPRTSKDHRGKIFNYAHIDFCTHSYLSCLHTFKGLYWAKLKKANWQWLERNIFAL
jgi:hypothetical protein